MTATYTNQPGTVDIDTVRFEIDDRDTIPATDAALTDEEIQYLIDGTTHILLAAAAAAETIAATYAATVETKKVGDLELSYGDDGPAAKYATLAKTLRQRAKVGAGANIYAGGISHADKAVAAADTDRVDSVFTIGMHDNKAGW